MQAIINATNKLFGEIQKEVVAIDGLTEEQILAIGNIFSKNFEGKVKGKKTSGTRKKTGYQLFSKFHRQELKDANQLDGKEFGEITKMIAADWKALGDDQEAWKQAAADGLEKPEQNLNHVSADEDGSTIGDNMDHVSESSSQEIPFSEVRQETPPKVGGKGKKDGKEKKEKKEKKDGKGGRH